MPWWGWLVIWAGLALALLTVLTLFAVLLFGKVRAIALELERLASLAMILDRAGDVLDDQRAEIAVLANIARVRSRREHVRFEASLRRQARRRDSIQRAKGLLRVDASQRDWFPAHDHTTRHDPR